MSTIEKHRDDIGALIRPVLAQVMEDSEWMSIDSLIALGSAGHGYRVVAGDVVSPVDLPRFDNSQMDGFALHHADAGTPLRVVPAIPAGVMPPGLDRGTIAPIMTGARLPIGADAVVPVEEIGPGRFPEALALEEVVVPAVPAGRFVRRSGSDVSTGAVLARRGSPVTPSLLGTLAAASVTAVAVSRRPRVLVVSTGTELVTSGTPEDGVGASIGDANGVSLRAALAEVGVDARAVAVDDDPAALVEVLAAELRNPVDLVITTGGISMGAYEVVREALEPRGLTVSAIAMQPGGPQAWGVVTLDAGPVPVVSFPGNPVSALISFEVFLRPLLAEFAGLDASRPSVQLPSAEAVDSPAGKHQIRRGTVVDGRVHFVGGASSHLIAHYAEATHLVHIPLGVGRVEAGDALTVWRIR